MNPAQSLAITPSAEWAHQLGASSSKRMTASWSGSTSNRIQGPRRKPTTTCRCRSDRRPPKDDRGPTRRWRAFDRRGRDRARVKIDVLDDGGLAQLRLTQTAVRRLSRGWSPRDRPTAEPILAVSRRPRRVCISINASAMAERPAHASARPGMDQHLSPSTPWVSGSSRTANVSWIRSAPRRSAAARSRDGFQMVATSCRARPSTSARRRQRRRARAIALTSRDADAERTPLRAAASANHIARWRCCRRPQQPRGGCVMRPVAIAPMRTRHGSGRSSADAAALRR